MFHQIVNNRKNQSIIARYLSTIIVYDIINIGSMMHTIKALGP